jgi:hypothetical protein
VPDADLSGRLALLADRTLARLSRPDADGGAWVPSVKQASGYRQSGYYDPGPDLVAWVEACYELELVLSDFDWPEWSGTAEAASLRDDPEALANTTPIQLAQLITVLVREDRFCEGALGANFASGLLLRLTQRAAALGPETQTKEEQR